jgi:hypothetical protein
MIVHFVSFQGDLLDIESDCCMYVSYSKDICFCQSGSWVFIYDLISTSNVGSVVTHSLFLFLSFFLWLSIWRGFNSNLVWKKESKWGSRSNKINWIEKKQDLKDTRSLWSLPKTQTNDCHWREQKVNQTRFWRKLQSNRTFLIPYQQIQTDCDINIIFCIELTLSWFRDHFLWPYSSS